MRDGTIKFKWRLSKDDKEKIGVKEVYCLGIRLFEVIPSDQKDYSLCIMKEVEVNKYSNIFYMNSPATQGEFNVEIGCKNISGSWEKLISSHLFLGIRIPFKSSNNDNWFSNLSSKNKINSFHERMYRISSTSSKGGSESAHK